jgi:uncharacterized protein
MFFSVALHCLAQNRQLNQGILIDRPETSVTDNSHILKSGEIEKLRTKLARLNQTAIGELIVFIDSTLNNRNLEEYTFALAKHWSFGKDENDNYIIIFIFTREKMVRIEVGYGLAGIITDQFAQRILDDDIVPAFKSGRYGYGLSQAVDHILLELLLFDVEHRR